MTSVYIPLVEELVICKAEKVIIPSAKEVRFTAWVSVILMSNKRDEYIKYDDSRLDYYGGGRHISYELSESECSTISQILNVRLIIGIGGIHVQKL